MDEQLLVMLARAQATENHLDRLSEVASALVIGLDCDSVRIYMLRLRLGDYEIEAASPAVAAEHREQMQYRDLALIKSRESTDPYIRRRDVFVLPINRGENTPFYILIEGAKVPFSMASLLTALSPLGTVQSDRRAVRILQQLPLEFDYWLPQESFLKQLGRAVLTAAGMQFAALRIVRGDRLDCMAAWGLGDDPDLTALSLVTKEHFEFAQAADGKSVSVADIAESGSRSLTRVSELEHVRAFVALPVMVGSEIFGVLSLATTCRYAFSEVELDSFRALASIVGVAMGNYRATNVAGLSLSQLSELSMRSTIEVIASSAKHTGRHLVDSAIIDVGRARTEKNAAIRKEYLDDAEGALTDLDFLFERMKLVLDPPKYEWQMGSIPKLWEEALKQFKSKFFLLQIRPFSPKIDYETLMYPDWIRTAFMQLLINSVDAFAGKGYGLSRAAGEGRFVRLDIERPHQDENFVRLRYVDNAGGINPAGLQSRKEDTDLPVEQRIFRPGASAKGGDGTGWGLPLVRTALQEHHGSITLADNSRRGVTFDILLPKRPTDKFRNK